MMCLDGTLSPDYAEQINRQGRGSVGGKERNRSLVMKRERDKICPGDSSSSLTRFIPSHLSPVGHHCVLLVPLQFWEKFCLDLCLNFPGVVCFERVFCLLNG